MFSCPFCRTQMTEADVEASRCPKCGLPLPGPGETVIDDDSSRDGLGEAGGTVQLDDDAHTMDEGASRGTVQFDSGDAAAANRTMDMDGSVPSVEPGMGTMPIDDDDRSIDALEAEETGRTFQMDAPEHAGNTIDMDWSDVDDGSSTDGPSPTRGETDEVLGTISMEEGVQPDAQGATVQIPDEGIAAQDQGSTVRLDDGIGQVAPDEMGSMRTITFSGEAAPGEDASLKTVDMSDATGAGDRTMADISQSALFDKGDEKVGGSTGGTPSSSMPSGSSGSFGTGSSLKGLSSASGETFVSDEWADPGIDKTIGAGGMPNVEQIVKTVWMEAGNASPGMTLRGREPKKAVKPATGTPLVIKSRVLKKREDSVPGEQVEYELLKVLGEGGMGVVYDARQTSIDRGVALKMLKGGGRGDDKARQKFLAEAVVTGDLDHPNIVPIYDVGTNDQGHLFYSMKKVQGTPWQKLLPKKNQAENIEILMKVADAVAFAHARGVVHRDLKPENVMLGDYGEVLVMDWGLAQSTSAFKKRSSITESTGMGGTPAYMAPEMATGPIDKIGLPADVYLLGAILYEIVTGKPPHQGKNAMMCLMSAAKNEIIPTEKTGELVEIAKKAMATAAGDRYPSVLEFQKAIREYLSHSESIALSTRASEDLEVAQKSEEYKDYAKAMFGFQEAIDLWPENTRAAELLKETKHKYATCALKKGDYDLGASLLDSNDVEHRELLGRIKQAVIEREKRQQRLKTMKRAIGGMVAVGVLGVIVAAALIESQRREAVAQRAIAVTEKVAADQARDIAKNAQKEEAAQKVLAVNARIAAENAEKDAVKQRDIARDAQRAAEKAQALEAAAKQDALNAAEAEKLAKEAQRYEAYVASIGLAAAQIKENSFKEAQKTLEALIPKEGEKELRSWEWGRLMHVCSLEEDDFELGTAPIDALAVSPDGTKFIAGQWNRKARIVDIATKQTLLELPQKGLYVHAVAFSSDGKTVATGSSVANGTYDAGDNLCLWNAETGELVRKLPGHKDAVISIAFSKDGKKLLTSSFDATARLWSLDNPSDKPVEFVGHHWTVGSAAFSPDETQIVTASSDGTARIWNLSGSSLVTFRGHRGPVYSAAFSPDGKQVVSGGLDRRVLLWNASETKDVDYEQIIRDVERGVDRPQSAGDFIALEGHEAAVRSVVFSPDGTQILSAGQDNTCKLWDVADRSLIRTFRGHDQLVRTALFLPGSSSGILTASHDGHVMLWSTKGKVDFRVLAGRVLDGHAQEEVLSASFSKDGQSVVTASRDRTANTWDLNTGAVQSTLQEGHKFLASAAIFFPGGQKMLTAAVDGSVRIWNVDTGTEVLRLDGTGQQSAVALSNDGKWIATGGGEAGEDGRDPVWLVKLWDAESGTLAKSFPGHTAEVTAVAFTSDGATIVSGDARGDALVWSVADGKSRTKLGAANGPITGVKILPNDSRALVASVDSTVGQWDLATGQEIPRLLLKHPDDVLSMDLSQRGQEVVTSCKDGRVRVWNVETAAKLLEVAAGGRIENVRFSPDGMRFAGIEADPTKKLVHVWNTQDGQEVLNNGKPFIQVTEENRSLWSLAFAPRTRADSPGYLVTVGGSEARLWNVTGQEVIDYTPHSAVATASFSPDGDLVITGGWDFSARIWNRLTGKDQRKLEGHVDNVNSACFSPDGSKALTASNDKTARLWDVATGQLLKTFSGHSGAVYQAAFSQNGRLILTASSDHTARVWDAETGEVVHVLGNKDAGHKWSVRSIAISNDGKWIATGSDDNSAILWNEAGQPVRTLSGHTASVFSVAFSPDGGRLLTGSSDSNVKLWDVQSGKEVLTLDGHSREITSVSFSPDGRSVLTSSRDGTARLWPASEWKSEPAVAGK